jgi:hypothetical protein
LTDLVRVITTCTSRKLLTHVDDPTTSLPGLAAGSQTVQAERLYTGEQHRRLMAGVSTLRASRPVEVWVISARAGLISGEHELGPYDDSFAGLPRDKVRATSDRLRIAEDLRALVAKSAACTLLLAGNEYFDAARLDETVDWASPTLILASPSRAARAPDHPRLRTVAVSQALAKRWSLPLILLKGELAGRLLRRLADGTISPRHLLGDDVLHVVHRSEHRRIAC